MVFTTPPTLLTVKQFSDKHIAFSEASIRSLIFNAQPRPNVIDNGLAPAIKRIGGRILIDEQRFFTWVYNGANAGSLQISQGGQL